MRTRTRMMRKVVVVLGIVVLVVAMGLRGVGKRARREPARPMASQRAGHDAPVRRPGHEDAADAVRAGERRLEGQVLGPDGAPVGGAEVTLGRSAGRTTTSEADGSFAFDQLAEGVYALSAVRDALIAGPVMHRLSEHSDPVVLRLGESASAVVTVIDDAKRPIAEAAIAVRVGMPGERVLHTGTDGSARVAPIAPGFLAVEVTAAGYAPAAGSLMLGSPGAKGALTITLHRGVAISGRVIDDAGAPVAGARIDALGAMGGWMEATAAMSGEDGSFAIASIANGRYTLRAKDDEHAPARSAPVDVAGVAVTGVTIEMSAGGVIVGRVVDAAHRPVASAGVSVLAVGTRTMDVEPRNTVTDRQGGFELRGLARVALQVMASSPHATSAQLEADLAARASLQLELVLGEAETIAGRVVDAAGAGIAEVQVTAMPEVTPEMMTAATASSRRVSRPSTATTRGDGSFVVEALASGPYRMSATRPPGRLGSGEPGQQAVIARTGDKDVRIVLAAPGALVAKVVLAGSDVPPKDVTLMMTPLMPVTASDGVFDIKDISPGTYQVLIRSQLFADIAMMKVEIKAGETTDLGTITATRGRVIVGKVVDATGAPVAGARVRLGVMRNSSPMAAMAPPDEGFGMLANIRSAETGADGTFSLAGVPARMGRAQPLLMMAYEPGRGVSPMVSVAESGEDAPMVLMIGGATTTTTTTTTK